MMEKCNTLLDIVQQGESHEDISAEDKDFVEIFNKICQFVTKDVFKWVGNEIPNSKYVHS